MKKGIHPDYKEILVRCACGEQFNTRSTLGEELVVEICSRCHPFFTGKQKLIDTAGRVEKFKTRYAKMQQKKEEAPTPEKEEVSAPAEQN